METIKNYLNKINIEDLMPYITSWGGKILAALAIYFIGRIIVRSICKIANKVMAKSKIDSTLSNFLSSAISTILMLFVILAVLGQIGIETTSFIAIIGAAGLAIGLAFQDSLSNLAAGVLLIIFRPFDRDHFIEGAGTSGTVKEIGILVTTLKTPDNKRVIVPNSKLIGDNIINYTATGKRRVDLTFGCGYNDDILAVKKLLEKIVKANKKILSDPEPVIAVAELADSSVNFAVRPWVKTDDYWDVYFELTEKVKIEFDKAGFSIPYPQQDVHMHNQEAK